VCHGVTYDQEMYEYFSNYRYDSAAMNIVYKGMEVYLKKKPKGKKFHDPLALAVAIDPSVCEFREVKRYRENREWGAELQLGTNTYISINADQNKMMEILTDKNNQIA
jgi:inosine-uridine nucleoside N-ribohydrolase